MNRHLYRTAFTRSNVIASALVFGVFVLSPLNSFAQSSSRVAVINLARAVETCADGRAAAEQWTARMEERTAELQIKQAELLEMRQKVESPEPGTPESELIRQNRNIERLNTDLERMSEDADAEMNAYRQELLVPITEKVDQAIAAYAAERGLAVILDSSNPQGSLLFVQDVADITTEIIRRVNAMPVEAEGPGPRI